MKARENPFSVRNVERIRYRPLNTSMNELLGRVEQIKYCGCISGPHGSGKTTLLEDVQSHLTKKGGKTLSVFINDSHPLTRPRRIDLITNLTGREIVFIDGADLIDPFTWFFLKNRIIKKCTGLIVTSHRSGLLPSLIECRTSCELLGEIVARLLPQNEMIRSDLLKQIYHQHSGNIRNCLRQLYDIYANN
ncbi:MAG: GTP-binding protein [Planctomycetota bacterium]|jgi:hypothetical protein